jgi:hypothetical protein
MRIPERCCLICSVLVPVLNVLTPYDFVLPLSYVSPWVSVHRISTTHLSCIGDVPITTSILTDLSVLFTVPRFPREIPYQ